MRVRMDVSQPEFEWRWGSAGIHWLGSTHVLWQVQQEALTISLQAPCGSKRRRTTQTTSLRTTPIRSRVAGCYSQYMLKVARRMEVGSESRHSAAEASSPAVQDALRRSKSSRKARHYLWDSRTRDRHKRRQRLRKRCWQKRLCGQSRQAMTL